MATQSSFLDAGGDAGGTLSKAGVGTTAPAGIAAVTPKQVTAVCMPMCVCVLRCWYERVLALFLVVMVVDLVKRSCLDNAWAAAFLAFLLFFLDMLIALACRGCWI